MMGKKIVEPEMKSLQEVQAEFEKMSDAEKSVIYNMYELLGVEVVKWAGRDYVRILSHLKKMPSDIRTRNALFFDKRRLEAWFDCNLQRWVITDLSGKEFLEKIVNQLNR